MTPRTLAALACGVLLGALSVAGVVASYVWNEWRKEHMTELHDGFSDRYEVSYRPVGLRRRPRWKRVLRMPHLFLNHYRIFRKHNGRLASAHVSARSALLLWK